VNIGKLRLLGSRRARLAALVTVPLLVAGVLVLPGSEPAGARIVVSSITSGDGTVFTLTNHLLNDLAGGASAAGPGGGGPGKYLIVWAGDENISDHTGLNADGALRRTLDTLSVDTIRTLGQDIQTHLPGPDFLAVIDADPASPDYGKVVNTVTASPLIENEPHHMQYIWHKGDRVFAGGLYTDTTYVFDVSNLPEVRLVGVNMPTDTLCGSVPDAYWTLSDGTAYGTYMGGPDLPGPCLYSNGEMRTGNGFAGTPGSLVRIDANGKTLSEVPAALPTPEDPVRCPGLPLIHTPSCANPHGIQVREDLNRMITTDYAEPKNVVTDPLRPLDPNLFRDTVRIWDISERNNAKVVSVSAMPDGPRHERNPGHEEPRGIMEGTVTNLPQHKGAFASSMCGGVIYYTPDITNPNPVWREVFDDTAAARMINSSNLTEGAGCAGGGWVQTSLDDRFLYHAVIGRNPGSLEPQDPGVPKMVYTLNIQPLLAAGNDFQCNIDTIDEVYNGGDEADCPVVADVLELPDRSSGGPHWGALDNFVPAGDGKWRETTDVRRIATSNYFVARSTVDGNHKVCIVNVSAGGDLTLDESFLDENEGTPCVTFNRNNWPHGAFGNAKPHSELFVVTGSALE
jgi:hypothetical protein